MRAQATGWLYSVPAEWWAILGNHSWHFWHW
jgi:hypothetical protein